MTTSDSLPQQDPSEPSFAHGPVDPSDGDDDTAELEEVEGTEGTPGPAPDSSPEPTD